MKIAVLGTGMVGETIASKLVTLGHEVKMGSRAATNEKAQAWVAKAGRGASQGTFAEAAAFGEIVFNCTLGAAALEVLAAAGAQNLANKVLIDTSNPLDFSKGMPPSLFTSSADSLGEQIQRAFLDAKVVKCFNTISAHIMVEPGRLKGDHDLFMSGNDAGAKAKVAEIAKGWFGWTNVVDVGDISAARGMEAYVLLWVRLWGALGTADFNVKLVR